MKSQIVRVEAGDVGSTNHTETEKTMAAIRLAILLVLASALVDSPGARQDRDPVPVAGPHAGARGPAMHAANGTGCPDGGCNG